MMRLRHADEWVGLLVVLAVVLLLAAALHAGVLSAWFRPASSLRVLLPQEGVAGLSQGANVEVLGTKAGTVRRVVINPDQQMYAEADIDDQARAFIRRDSQAVIRRQFGVAGAAYLDVSRGKGQPLDWNYAVINAVTERAPTDSIGTMIDQVRQKVFPILDDVGHSTHALAGLVENIQQGKGNVGRLLVDDSLARSAEAMVASLKDSVAQIGPIMAKLRETSQTVAALAKEADARDKGVPALMVRLNVIMVSMQEVSRNLAQTSQRLPQITRNVQGSTANLPGLLTQTQVTMRQLEQLTAQLRTSWLLGGGGSPPAAASNRLPSTEVRP
jgi:phospholipid/cholesterol/gamma-HCH transport system substrate-binding protein